MLSLSPTDLAIDLLRCLRFWSRLPTPILASEKDPHGFPDFSRITRMLPLAGAIIGAVGALALGLAHWLRLPSSIAAGLTLAALILATGAFHEDGLADTADGLGGGATRQRKLEIMKDSRIGANLRLEPAARIGRCIRYLAGTRAHAEAGGSDGAL